MINPQLVLPTVLPHLHPGAVCAVYLAKCVSPLLHIHLSIQQRLNDIFVTFSLDKAGTASPTCYQSVLQVKLASCRSIFRGNLAILVSFSRKNP